MVNANTFPYSQPTYLPSSSFIQTFTNYQNALSASKFLKYCLFMRYNANSFDGLSLLSTLYWLRIPLKIRPTVTLRWMRLSAPWPHVFPSTAPAQATCTAPQTGQRGSAQDFALTIPFAEVLFQDNSTDIQILNSARLCLT